jgi:multiple sugar transport system substrate-binding protein
MKKLSPFQVGIVIFFIICIIVAVLIFIGVIGGGTKSQTQTAQGNVVLWGTYPSDVMSKLFDSYNASHQKYSVTYVEIGPTDLDSKLSDAIASGVGPDMVILTQDQIVNNQSKLYTIPYQSLTQSTFRATYAQEGELFMLPQGTIALPLTIDPLVLYYNRDLLEAAGITQPPTSWNQLVSEIPLLTKTDSNNNIVQSGIPFGIYGNLNNARAILSMFFLQAGDPIVTTQGGQFLPVLSQASTATAGNQSASPAEAVVNFFTQFVDPTKSTYTWNRSFQNARQEFINGELAFYIDYASELPLIATQNPNLNFDVAKVPQANDTGAQVTFGNVAGVAIVKATKNMTTAFTVMSDLTGSDFESQLVTALLPVAPVAPARRDLLTTPPQVLFGPVLYNSAVIARGWYDPGESQTDPIFNDMIDSVVRGASDVGQAVGDAQNSLMVVFHQ